MTSPEETTDGAAASQSASFRTTAEWCDEARGKSEEELSAAIGQLVESPPGDGPGLRRAAAYYLAAGRDEDAVSALERAVESGRQANDRNEVADSMHMLGRAHQDRGEVEKAAQVLVSTREYEAELKRLGRLLPFLLDLGDVLLRRKRTPEAKKIFERASGMASGGDLVRALECLVELHVDERHWQDAEQASQRWLDVAAKHGDLRAEARASTRLAFVSQRRRNWEGSREAHQNAVRCYEQLDDPELRPQLCRALSDFGESCRRSRLLREAGEVAERACGLAREVGDVALDLLCRERLAFVLRDRGEFVEAAECLESLVELVGDDKAAAADALQTLAEVYVSAGDNEKAEDAMRRAVAASRELGDGRAAFDAEMKLGDLLLDIGRLPQGLSAFERALKLAGDDTGRTTRALGGKARALERSEEWKWAVVVLDRRLELFREERDTFGQAQTLLDIARVHRAEGRLDQAIYTLEQCIRVARSLRKPLILARALHGMGDCAAANGDAASARQHLEEAAGRFLAAGRGRTANPVLELLEKVLESEHREDEFVDVVDDIVAQAIRQAPKWGKADAYLEGARVLTHFGLLESAERVLGKARSSFGDDGRLLSAVLQLLGQVLRHAGRGADAVGLYQERVDLERKRDNRRDLAYALNSLGAAQVDAGEVEAAIASFREALELMEAVDDRGGIAVVLNGLAMPLHLNGQSDEALAALDRGLEIQRDGLRSMDESVTLNTRGEILRELGRTAEALRDLERCLEMTDEQEDERGLAFVLPRIGRARLAAGQTEKALEDFERGTRVATRVPDRRQRVRALHAFGEGLKSAGQSERALEVLRDASTLVADMQDSMLREAVATALRDLDGGPA